MNIDLRKLKQLVTAARLGSLSRAAECLHLSQPAISRNIHLIEEEMGLRIFERTPQGIELSEAGKVAIREAEKLLEQVRVFDHNWDLYRKGESGSLRFGIWSLAGSVILPGLLEHMASHRKQLKLWAAVNDHQQLLEGLYERDNEFLVCRADQIARAPELESEHLGNLQLAAFVRVTHPLAHRRDITREDMYDFPILSGQDPANVPDYFANNGIFFSENSEVMRHVAINTDSIWVVPAQLAEPDVLAGQLIRLPLWDPQRSSIAIHVIRLKGYELSPAAQYVLNYLRRENLFNDSCCGAREQTRTV